MKYRCYTFNNFYLQGIQAGIQAAHSVTEMFAKAEYNKGNAIGDEEKNKADLIQDTLYEWANNHKTMIVLNGGMQQDLHALNDQLVEIVYDLALPYATFRESQEALNGAMTSISVVVPDCLYNAAKLYVNWVNGKHINESINKVEWRLDGVYITMGEHVGNEIKYSIENRKYSQHELDLMYILQSYRLMN